MCRASSFNACVDPENSDWFDETEPRVGGPKGGGGEGKDPRKGESQGQGRCWRFG